MESASPSGPRDPSFAKSPSRTSSSKPNQHPKSHKKSPKFVSPVQISLDASTFDSQSPVGSPVSTHPKIKSSPQVLLSSPVTSPKPERSNTKLIRSPISNDRPQLQPQSGEILAPRFAIEQVSKIEDLVLDVPHSTRGGGKRKRKDGKSDDENFDSDADFSSSIDVNREGSHKSHKSGATTQDHIEYDGEKKSKGIHIASNKRLPSSPGDESKKLISPLLQSLKSSHLHESHGKSQLQSPHSANYTSSSSNMFSSNFPVHDSCDHKGNPKSPEPEESHIMSPPLKSEFALSGQKLTDRSEKAHHSVSRKKSIKGRTISLFIPFSIPSFGKEGEGHERYDLIEKKDGKRSNHDEGKDKTGVIIRNDITNQFDSFRKTEEYENDLFDLILEEEKFREDEESCRFEKIQHCSSSSPSSNLKSNVVSCPTVNPLFSTQNHRSGQKFTLETPASSTSIPFAGRSPQYPSPSAGLLSPRKSPSRVPTSKIYSPSPPSIFTNIIHKRNSRIEKQGDLGASPCSPKIENPLFSAPLSPSNGMFPSLSVKGVGSPSSSHSPSPNPPGVSPREEHPTDARQNLQNISHPALSPGTQLCRSRSRGEDFEHLRSITSQPQANFHPEIDPSKRNSQRLHPTESVLRRRLMSIVGRSHHSSREKPEGSGQHRTLKIKAQKSLSPTSNLFEDHAVRESPQRDPPSFLRKEPVANHGLRKRSSSVVLPLYETGDFELGRKRSSSDPPPPLSSVSSNHNPSPRSRGTSLSSARSSHTNFPPLHLAPSLTSPHEAKNLDHFHSHTDHSLRLSSHQSAHRNRSQTRESHAMDEVLDISESGPASMLQAFENSNQQVPIVCSPSSSAPRNPLHPEADGHRDRGRRPESIIQRSLRTIVGRSQATPKRKSDVPPILSSVDPQLSPPFQAVPSFLQKPPEFNASMRKRSSSAVLPVFREDSEVTVKHLKQSSFSSPSSSSSVEKRIDSRAELLSPSRFLGEVQSHSLFPESQRSDGSDKHSSVLSSNRESVAPFALAKDMEKWDPLEVCMFLSSIQMERYQDVRLHVIFLKFLSLFD
jgi:hypothetical protein